MANDTNETDKKDEQQTAKDNTQETTSSHETEQEHEFIFSGTSKSAPASDLPAEDSPDAHDDETQPNNKTIKIAQVDDTVSKIRHAASNQGYENPDNTGQTPLTETKVN